MHERLIQRAFVPITGLHTARTLGEDREQQRLKVELDNGRCTEFLIEVRSTPRKNRDWCILHSTATACSRLHKSMQGLCGACGYPYPNVTAAPWTYHFQLP